MRAFRVAYDGTNYRGFQRQPHGETVENAILGALRELDALPEDADTPPGYAAAGRTDAGVSAVAQTVAFEVPDWLTPAAFNAGLPADVRAWASAETAADFHATRDAMHRTYEYHLHAREAGGVAVSESGADDDRARAACEALSGAHDFHNLTPDSRRTERDLRVTCERDGDYLVCTFTASGFPRQLVRRAVTLIGAVAAGERDLAFVERALSADSLEGPEGVPPAAPEPLVLVGVAYPDLSFERDDRAAASAESVFEERRVCQRTGARIASRLRDL